MKLPSWITKSKDTPDVFLPEWATLSENNSGIKVVTINADQAYPDILGEIKSRYREYESVPLLKKRVDDLNPSNPSPYWVEVAYQFAKLQVRHCFLLCGLTPWPPNLNMIRIKGSKTRWKAPATDQGVILASKHKEARMHYKMMRGFLPN